MDYSERLEQKIDKIATRVGNIDVTLAGQHVTLKEHIRRCDLLEQAVKPMEEKWSRLEGVLQFFGVVASGLAAVEGFLALLHWLHK